MSDYKLSDRDIFKPAKRKLAPEEELQARKDAELFCDMLEKNGIASLLNPSEEISREQMYANIRSGKLIINDYNDGTGQYSFSDYLKHKGSHGAPGTGRIRVGDHQGKGRGGKHPSGIRSEGGRHEALI